MNCKRIFNVFFGLLLASSMVFLLSCNNSNNENSNTDPNIPAPPGGNNNPFNPGNPPGGNIDPNNPDEGNIAENEESFGDLTNDYLAGYFSEDSKDYTLEYVSGTKEIDSFLDDTLTFSTVSEDTVYAISGKFKGNIVIDTGDDFKFELVMKGFSMVSDSINPITILSGDKVTLSAKKDTVNYLYDDRDVVDDTLDGTYQGSIYSAVDLDIEGKGALTVYSKNNNGIHSKKDLSVKNLSLVVKATDNALKGNDSVTINSGKLSLISTSGDGIKTTNSDLSSKGNQRGIVSISSSSVDIYAARDGIDASYDVNISDPSTVLNIYTNKYSNYSTDTESTTKDTLYLRYNSNQYNYSVKYYNSDTDFKWVNADFYKMINAGRDRYYYYQVEKLANYKKMAIYFYNSNQASSLDNDYTYHTDYLSINNNYDTLAFSSRGGSINYNWTNYTTTTNPGPGGLPGGGMAEGNTDKLDYSTKGIKAANSILIEDGTINIKSYDDSIHASSGNALENGETSLGNITINNGKITLYSNDDGIHADNLLKVTGGSITVNYSYEGFEGLYVSISGGDININSKDDGINATTTSGEGIVIDGGNIYIYATGDGLDSNSRTSYSGIIFKAGVIVVVSNSGGNSAIDTENGYQYQGGIILAIMPSRGMTNEVSLCSNFKSVSTTNTMSLSEGVTVTVMVDKAEQVKVEMPCSLDGYLVYLGSASATFTTK